jgi:hypothetical protein
MTSGELWLEIVGIHALGGNLMVRIYCHFNNDLDLPWTTTLSFISGVFPGIMTIHRALRYEPANFTQFEDYVRNFIHDVIHWRIGGTMGDRYGSRSPEFMLHHTFLDKIWSDFQHQSPQHKWAFFKNADYKIYKTSILARNVVDNDNLFGARICYKDPFDSYKDTHRALKEYDLHTVRKMMTKRAFSAPYFESYFYH